MTATWTTPFLSVLATSKHLLSNQGDLIESAFYASYFVHVMHLTVDETGISYLVLPSVSGHVTMFLLDSLVVGAFLWATALEQSMIFWIFQYECDIQMSSKSKQTAARTRDKWREKIWYQILAPDYFDNKDIGRTPAGGPEQLVGRTVQPTLYDITGDFDKIHVKLRFKIMEVAGQQAKTVFYGHEWSSDYLRGLVRRGTSRIDWIGPILTKDDYLMRISVIVFTTTRAKTSQEHAVRQAIEKVIRTHAKKHVFDELVTKVILGDLAAEVREEVRKIIPIRESEIRKSKVLKGPEEVKVRRARLRRGTAAEKEKRE
jgi:small subunit ribosomal protein S3Ae